MKRITLDTNVLPAEDLAQVAQSIECEFAIVSVTKREVHGTHWEVEIKPFPVVPELGIYGEFRWAGAKYASVPSAGVLEHLLHLISNGPFPQSRANLSKGRRRLLRDALILEAHIREQRDILVTNDRHAFIDQGRREEIQTLFPIRIMTKAELTKACVSGLL